MKTESRIALVTGSSGTIGSAAMRRFAGRFDSIVGFDHEAPKPPPLGCVHVAVEFTSDESVQEGLRTLLAHHGEHIATVIQFPARSRHRAIRQFRKVHTIIPSITA